MVASLLIWLLKLVATVFSPNQANSIPTMERLRLLDIPIYQADYPLKVPHCTLTILENSCHTLLEPSRRRIQTSPK